MAKAALWPRTDTKARKRGERTGLDTPGSPRRKRCILGVSGFTTSAVANALSIPPGEYARKGETQRN